MWYTYIMKDIFTKDELRHLDNLEAKSSLKKLNNITTDKEDLEYISTVFSSIGEVCSDASSSPLEYYGERDLSPIPLCACRQMIERCEYSLSCFYDNLPILVSDKDSLDRFFADFFKLADLLLKVSEAETFPEDCNFIKEEWTCNLSGLSKFEALIQLQERLKKWVSFIKETYPLYSNGLYHYQSWLLLFIIPINIDWNSEVPVK